MGQAAARSSCREQLAVSRIVILFGTPWGDWRSVLAEFEGEALRYVHRSDLSRVILNRGQDQSDDPCDRRIAVGEK